MPDRTIDTDLPGSASEEYGRLTEKHRKCEERLSELRDRLFLTEEEKLEEVNLKKQKLHLKDRMEALMRGRQNAGARQNV